MAQAAALAAIGPAALPPPRTALQQSAPPPLPPAIGPAALSPPRTALQRSGPPFTPRTAFLVVRPPQPPSPPRAPQACTFKVHLAVANILAAMGVHVLPVQVARLLEADPEPPQHLAPLAQISTWSWDWMEPLLGTAGSVLLAAQFVRSNAKKMNPKPYAELVLSCLTDRLTRPNPQSRALFRPRVRA
eukprot:TRINITY_DN22855_c0_g1_i18.p2 TRINITY_DN22855_c0_g1~~TRINITY_DN22855_c0_g1_i18.p2  ORF type:complete len:188 (+),score=16.04 TRINITY_DN22855_c0_g1_i18:95-658(+)